MTFFEQMVFKLRRTLPWNLVNVRYSNLLLLSTSLSVCFRSLKYPPPLLFADLVHSGRNSLTLSNCVVKTSFRNTEATHSQKFEITWGSRNISPVQISARGGRNTSVRALVIFSVQSSVWVSVDSEICDLNKFQQLTKVSWSRITPKLCTLSHKFPDKLLKKSPKDDFFAQT